MSWKYYFIDHTADIAFVVEGDTIEELFIASALAWKESVVEEFQPLSKIGKEIVIEDSSYEELLVHFLGELNFLFQTGSWILTDITEIKIEEVGNTIRLSAALTGEEIVESRHKLKMEIKAVTFHQMEIRKINDKFFTRIVLDI